MSCQQVGVERTSTGTAMDLGDTEHPINDHGILVVEAGKTVCVSTCEADAPALDHIRCRRSGVGGACFLACGRGDERAAKQHEAHKQGRDLLQRRFHVDLPISEARAASRRRGHLGDVRSQDPARREATWHYQRVSRPHTIREWQSLLVA